MRVVLVRLDTALAQNAELVELVAKLNERIADLLPVAKRKARKNKPTTPSEAPPPTLTEEQRRAFENRPRPPVKPPKGSAKRSAARPTGRSAVPQHLDAEEHELRPDECAHCASTDLHVVDVVVEEKLHVVKEHQRRRKVHRKTCRCRKCGQRTTARSTDAASPRPNSTRRSFWLQKPEPPSTTASCRRPPNSTVTVAPIALSVEGLPIGVQIVGPQYGDLGCIDFARLLEREYRGFVPPPGWE